MWTILVGILGAGIGSGIMAILLAALQRKWRKDDEEASKERIDPKLFNALISAQKVLMVDRVRYLGQSYIADRGITLEDKETLQEMYAAYKALGGNGHLTTVMAEVERLPVVTRKE